MSKFYIYCQYIHYYDWRDNTWANFKFQIQILHMYHISNGDSVLLLLLLKFGQNMPR